MDIMPAFPMPFVEEWQLHEDDGEMMLSAVARQFPTSMPPTRSGHPAFLEASCAWSVSDDSSSSQNAALSSDFSSNAFLVDEGQNCEGSLGTSSQLLYPPVAADYQNGQPAFADVSNECSANNDQDPIVINSTGPTTARFLQHELGHASQNADAGPDRVAKRRPRTQNHSCDPCRAGKKACDLRMNIVIDENKRPSTPCSTCDIRGMECKVGWLASRQYSQQIKKRAQTSKRVRESSNTIPDDGTQLDRKAGVDSPFTDSLVPVSTRETNLVRQFTVRETCLQKFRLWVDVVEMPITECLSKGCMPPTFKQGLAALSPLSTNLHSLFYWNQARSWIEDCWEMNKSSPWSSNMSAPHLFLAVSFLDSLFPARTTSQSRPSPISTSRDASINEAYKWVALAAATQYVFDEHEVVNPRARDIAFTTWHKAKHMVFSNISAVSSFRLALSLILFGSVLPPMSTSGDSTYEEDAAFAHCEGIRRLQELCFQARACIRGDLPTNPCRSEPGISRKTSARPTHPVQPLPQEAREDVLELIGSLQWLVVMGNSVTIATSRGRICAMPPHIGDSKAGRLLLTKDTGPPRSSMGDSSAVADGTYDQAIQESILTRARADLQPITALWRRDIAKEDMSDPLRESGSLVVLLFHTLALLTVDAQNVAEGSDASYDHVHQHLCAFMKLANVWRSGFGRFDKAMSSLSIRQSGQQVRQNVFFCSNDGDLAILLFLKLVDELEKLLAESPLPSSAKEMLCATIESTSAYRKKHRLISAIQISFLASAARDLAKEKQDDTGDDHGLRTFVKDIAAHPVSHVTALPIATFFFRH